jgi:GTP-binding protein
VIIFVVDVLSGITDLDEALAGMLRKIEKPVLMAVNKVDNNERRYDATVFYKLGLGEIHPISSINGSGTGDLLDVLVEHFTADKEREEEGVPRFAIVGRPNVGKSTLINTLIGEERNIVTTIAGTTRDSILTRYRKFSHDFFLIDTAGLRKKGRVSEDLEFYSVLRSIRAIETADVCLLLIDAERGMEAQDVNILHLIIRNRKGVVLLVNKWDLIKKQTNTLKEFEKQIRVKCAPFQDFPIIFVSAINKQRVFRVLETAMEVFNNRTQKIQTSALNKYMLEAIEAHPPPAHKGKYIRIKYVAQLPTHAPTFAFYANLPQYIREPYKRYLENRIREKFSLTGVPIQIFFRKK